MPTPARRPNRDPGEGAVAALTGGGPSQVGISGAMRARDVSRPTDDDVALAGRLVQVSRRPTRLARRDGPHQDGPRQAGSAGSSPDRSNSVS